MEKIRRRENRLNTHLGEVLERVSVNVKLDPTLYFCRYRVGLPVLFVYVLFLHKQVNSKGYKVCGEASSVCGTITINKRKVKNLA